MSTPVRRPASLHLASSPSVTFAATSTTMAFALCDQ
jgi:hypothetical protein